MLKAADTDIRDTVPALKEVVIQLQGAVGRDRVTDSYNMQSQRTTRGAAGKMIVHYPPLGATGRAPQRVDNWTELFRTERLFTVSLDTCGLTSTLFWALL